MSLIRYHDRVVATVRRDGETILDAPLVDPEPISPSDMQYIASVTLAEVPEDGAPKTWIVQVDLHDRLERAERGRPQCGCFVASAWNADGVTPLNPIAGSATTCDTDLSQIRFVMDSEIPVVRGTRRLR